MQCCVVRSRVARLDVDHDVVGLGLGELDRDVPIAVLVEYARVEQFELGLVVPSFLVLGDEARIRELRLRIQVPPLHPRMRRSAVLVEPVLLDVFAVVALRPGQPEEPFFEHRVASVPERERQAQRLRVVTDPGEAVLVPTVRTRSGLIVGERAPHITVRAVVLTNRSPCPLGHVRPPTLPLGIVDPRALCLIHARRARRQYIAPDFSPPGLAPRAVSRSATSEVRIARASLVTVIIRNPCSSLRSTSAAVAWIPGTMPALRQPLTMAASASSNLLSPSLLPGLRPRGIDRSAGPT